MNMNKKRSPLIVTIAVCVISLLATSFSYAAENEINTLDGVEDIPIFYINEDGEQVYTTSRTDDEIEAILDKQIQQEVDALIAADTANDISTRSSLKPTYKTEYGSSKTITAPYKQVSGQPTNGTQISTGGTINVDWSGGASFSISASFPTPYGSLGISVTPGKATTKVTGLGVNIPASKKQHYMVYNANSYICKPYIVYKIANGKKTVYNKGASKVWDTSNFDVRKC